MATLKRQSASGTWEYIQLTGQDVYGHILDDHTHNVPLSITKSAKDADGTYTVVEYRRKSNGKLLMRSTLSGGTAPQYTTRTMQYYQPDGVAILRTETYALSYDADGLLVSEV